MPNSKQIVYLSKAQYTELIANGSITVDGVTVTYDENDIYVTPQAEPVTDVKINNTSISSNGVANIPVASAINLGVMSTNNQYGIDMYGQHPCIKAAAEDKIKAGTDPWQPIVSDRLDYATFYGLAKAAGADMKNITPTTVGVYPDEQKGAIQDMLGISDLLAPLEQDYLADKAYAVGDMFTNNGKLYKVISAISEGGAIVVQDDGETVSGANAIQCKLGEETIKDVQVNGTSVLNNGVANVPLASGSVPGVVRTDGTMGTDMYGTKIFISQAGDAQIKAGTAWYKPIVPVNQHLSAFYGLAKAAGDTTQAASSNAVGTYTDEAKAAIKGMIGVNVDDVQVNGTSIVSNGVANISLGGTNTLGVVKSDNSHGIEIYQGNIWTIPAQDTHLKNGNDTYRIINTGSQHKAVFYGLAKAAGDTTQSVSSNAVGNYTDNAKASIKSMLGIVDGSTATVSVTGTTPSITAVENTRYTCGEVSTLTITPPASGICIIRFTSGTTPTALTATGVVWPAWFDATDLEADTTYEICITDGYGAVMSWAL